MQRMHLRLTIRASIAATSPRKCMIGKVASARQGDLLFRDCSGQSLVGSETRRFRKLRGKQVDEGRLIRKRWVRKITTNLCRYVRRVTKVTDRSASLTLL